MPPTNNRSSYANKAYLKDICLEVPGYRFTHRPYNADSPENFEFVGREESIQQLLDILLKGDNSGAYLVSGYRGMGKTSFINRVLSIADGKLRKKRGQRIRQVNVSFGKSNIDYNDLLKQLIFSLLKNVVNDKHKLMLWLIRPSKILLMASFIFLIYLYKLVPLPAVFSAIVKEFNSFGLLAIGILSMVLAFLIVKSFALLFSLSPAIRIYTRLTKLYIRTTAEINEEENIQSMVKNVHFGFFSRNSTKYPPLSSKEIEMELIEIINRIDRTSKKPWRGGAWRRLNRFLARFGYYRENMYVFVFDEMDKIDPIAGGDNYYDNVKENRSTQNNQTYFDEQRDRKQMMLNIISSMKNLVTASQAKFIFIAGREMFEASLADIADRQFSLGSIFNKIIYIDSFLKDREGEDPAGLSNLIENYLKHLLLPEAFVKQLSLAKGPMALVNTPFLTLYNDYLENTNFIAAGSLDYQERYKVILLLQQLIIYLTYRTNGSPKKLSRMVEEFIHNRGSLIQNEADSRHMIVVQRRDRPVKKSNQLFLHISYDNQFRVGFITYLYRPFLLNYSRRLKNYSDYLLVSTTYLFDHIIKFHPVAFSTRNLELVPEILSSSRTPQLRNFIDDILHFLSNSYIRDTEVTLFEYKFFNKVSNEILHLTNLFEEESAAFNFTLDESYPIKTHIRNKIVELRRIHKDYRMEQYDFIHSISALNSLLGDIRFFDQEYNDAVTAYSDALQALQNIGVKHEGRMDLIVLKIQLQLKIGLTFEKIKTYEDAMASFTGAMDHAFDIFKTVNDEDGYFLKTEMRPAHVSNSQLLRMSIQAFIANLFLIEKTTPSGVTIENVFSTFTLIEQLFDKSGRSGSNKDARLTRYLAFHHVAVLLYYKNLEVDGLHQLLRSTNELIKPRLTAIELPAIATGVHRHARFSNMSLHLNFLALRELHQFLNDRTQVKIDTEIASYIDQQDEPAQLIMKTFYFIKSRDLTKVSDKYFLTQCATVLSHISDILVSLVPGDLTHAKNKISLDRVFTNAFFDKLERLQKLHPSDEQDLSIDEIIRNWLDEFNPIIRFGFNGQHSDLMIQLILLNLYMSAKYYQAAGKTVESLSHYKRMLRVICSLTSAPTGTIAERAKYGKRVCDLADRVILRQMLKLVSSSTQGTDRTQILRYKFYLNSDSLYMPIDRAKFIYNNLSNNPEIRESILLFAELRLLVFPLSSSFRDDLASICDEQSLVHPCNSISSQWTRVLELKFQSELNWKILEEYFSPQFPEIFINGSFHFLMGDWRSEFYNIYSRIPDESRNRLARGLMTPVDYQALLKDIGEQNGYKIEDPQSDLILFFGTIARFSLTVEGKKLMQQFLELICNSLHCLHHIIEILQTYGPNYPGGYEFTGEQYKRLGAWMRFYHLGIEIQRSFLTSGNFDLRSEVQSLLSIESLRSLDALACDQMAIHNFRLAINLHHEGQAYKNKIQILNYLDDDFNDSGDHFACALERQQVNSGRIAEKIEKLEKALSGSQLFQYSSYVNSR